MFGMLFVKRRAFVVALLLAGMTCGVFASTSLDTPVRGVPRATPDAGLAQISPMQVYAHFVPFSASWRHAQTLDVYGIPSSVRCCVQAETDANVSACARTHSLRRMVPVLTCPAHPQRVMVAKAADTASSGGSVEKSIFIKATPEECFRVATAYEV